MHGLAGATIVCITHIPVWDIDVRLVAQQTVCVPLPLHGHVTIQAKLHNETGQNPEKAAAVKESRVDQLQEPPGCQWAFFLADGHGKGVNPALQLHCEAHGVILDRRREAAQREPQNQTTSAHRMAVRREESRPVAGWHGLLCTRAAAGRAHLARERSLQQPHSCRWILL